MRLNIRPIVPVIMIFLIHPFSAQNFAAEKTESAPDTTALQTRLQSLESVVSDLTEKLKKQQQEDELKKLLEEAAQLETVKKKEESGIGKKFHTGVRQQTGLNPNISVSGDFFTAVSSENTAFIREPSDFSYGQNGFFLREVELSFVAPLDPFTRGKTFISLEEGEISIEEGYMEWLNLPMHMNLKIGIFNPEFGILNRYHDHALPQFDRPKALQALFTSANMGGVGLASNFLLKPHFGADASLFDLAVIQGGTGQSFTNEGDLNLMVVANVTHFYDISPNTFFEWRLGGVTGHNDPDEKYRTIIGDLALNLKWVPIARSKYRTFDWKTEVFYSNRETPAGTVASYGFYSSVQNKLNARWWLSGRIDYAEQPYDAAQHEWAYTLAADFWQSEFVFTRIQYQFCQRSFTQLAHHDGPFPDDHSLIFQVNWAMGPHKHEAY
ncbi:hypothetical protein JXO59_09425 [candidate division KSB1 bacterium]|nr:hypothetical protein [candidate division KSB1 bacterium]